MALFQKQPLRQNIVLPYTLSTQSVNHLVVVGLGNPGKKYTNTRHNIGFKVLDKVATNLHFPNFTTKKDFKSETTEQSVGSNKIILVKPLTFMNESGQAIQNILQFYKIPIENLIVVHDELSIMFGQIRMRVGGQSAGHNGVKSIMQLCGVDFGRVRIGIKNQNTPNGDTSPFVLSSFSSEEKSHLGTLITEASLVVNEYIYGGTLPHDTRTILLA